MTYSPDFPAITLVDRLATAESFIAAGRHDEAEALLGEILQAAPDHAEALNALGASALARKAADRASEILAAAATRHPDHAGIVGNLGVAHQMAGRLAEAIICFERALALEPELDGPLLSLATTRFLNGEHDAARAAAAAVLARRPEEAAAISLLGLIEMATGDKDEAERHLRRALALNPGDAASLRALSIYCFERHRLGEALALAERARIAAPLDLDALEHVARCLAALGRYDEAKAACRKVMAFAPNHVGIREILARVLIVTGRPDAGIAELTKAVKANPKDLGALLALAATIRYAGRLQQALPFVEHALKLEPGHAAAGVLRREIEFALGRFALAPVEAGVQPPGTVLVPPRLSASDLILFARYLPILASRSEALKLVAGDHFRPVLDRLAIRFGYGEAEEGEKAVPLASLAALFGYDPRELPVAPPYLAPLPAATARWRPALAEHPGPRIGVLWEKHQLGFGMAEIRAALPAGCTPVSLMAGAARHDLKDWPEAVDAGLHLDGFDDMLAAIAELDLIVGPDVSALHLAGALGRPGLVILPAGFPWYWAAREGRSLWYPSVEVVLQQAVGRWQEPFAEVAEKLQAWRAGRGGNLAGLDQAHAVIPDKRL